MHPGYILRSETAHCSRFEFGNLWLARIDNINYYVHTLKHFSYILVIVKEINQCG